VWRKVKSDWDAWNARSLADESIVRLILDALMRIDGHLPGDFDAAAERILSSKANALLVLPDDPS
jgi:hypothetical protein